MASHYGGDGMSRGTIDGRIATAFRLHQQGVTLRSKATSPTRWVAYYPRRGDSKHFDGCHCRTAQFENIFRKSGDLPKIPHEAPLAMWLGPTLLAGLGLVIGVAPDLIAKSFVASAVSAARAEETTIKLALWHGLNPILALSVFTVLCGTVVYAGERIWRQLGSLADFDATLGPARWYHLGLDGLNWITRNVTQTLQSGYLRVYILVIIVTAIGLAGYTLLSRVELSGLSGWSGIQFHEWVIALLILCGTLGAVTSIFPTRRGCFCGRRWVRGCPHFCSLQCAGSGNHTVCY